MTTPSDINRIEVTVEDDLINVSIASTDAVDVSGTNVGDGAEVFKDKQSTVMRYRTITGDNTIGVTQNNNEIEKFRETIAVPKVKFVKKRLLI